MNDIEQKALAMVRKEDGHGYLNYDAALAALCRAIEQHEAFRQEVSDAVEQADLLDIYGKAGAYLILQRFIIPAPKPDPLVEVIAQIGWGNGWDDEEDYARQLRAALEARGLEIREKGQ
jgi:hypothetical protein